MSEPKILLVYTSSNLSIAFVKAIAEIDEVAVVGDLPPGAQLVGTYMEEEAPSPEYFKLYRDSTEDIPEKGLRHALHWPEDKAFMTEGTVKHLNWIMPYLQGDHFAAPEAFYPPEVEAPAPEHKVELDVDVMELEEPAADNEPSFTFDDETSEPTSEDEDEEGEIPAPSDKSAKPPKVEDKEGKGTKRKLWGRK